MNRPVQINNSLQKAPEIHSVVVIPIRKTEHADFLRDMFSGERGKPIKINRNEFTGKFIFSLRKYSKLPVVQKIPEGYIPVEFEFPETEYSQHNCQFCYYPLEHIEMINDYVSAFFDLYFHIYFTDTKDIDRLQCEDEFSNVEITRDVLIDSLVFGMDMTDVSKAIETTKKREYRKSVKEMVRKIGKFKQKDIRFRRKLYEKRRKNIYRVVFQYDKK
jgi:hypothetical protein